MGAVVLKSHRKQPDQIGGGAPGPGRPPGLQNKMTRDLKQAIIEAGENVGGNGRRGLVAYLETIAVQEPVAFVGLLGRVLPLQLSNAGDTPLVISWLPPGQEMKEVDDA